MYDFDKILLKPHIEVLDTNSQRIRRNLIIASIITYLFVIASNGIDVSASSFAGIKFYNLKLEYIQALLILSLIYFLTHFIWASFDHLKENKLRLTGIVIPMAQNGAFLSGTHDLHPNTDQEKNSTMFSWWWREKGKKDGYKQLIAEIKDNMEKENHEPLLSKIQQDLDAIQHRSSYIEEALVRFEKGFWKYQRSQLLRWILLDFSIPVLMGLAAIIAVIASFFSCS